MTKTAEIADVVLPGRDAWCESEGTVTNSERRVQRVRKALDPPGRGEGRHLDHRASSRRRLGLRLGRARRARGAGTSCASLSPMHARHVLRAAGGARRLQWPCPDEDHPGTQFLHARLWADDPAKRAGWRRSASSCDEPPVDELTDEYPIRLTTGRRLDSFNTGVQTGGLHLAAPAAARTIDALAGGRRRARRRRGRAGRACPRGAARSRRRARSTRRCGRGWRS